MSTLATITDEFAGQEGLVTFEWQAEGTVNDHLLDGHFLGAYSPEQNIFRARMDFKNDPELGSSYLLSSSCSYFSVCSCCINSRALVGSRNLLSIFGDHVRAEAYYTLWREAGQPTGSGTQFADVKFEPSGNGIHCTATEEFKLDMGDNLPTEYPFEEAIKFSPGYAVYLRQVSRGFIEGHIAYPHFIKLGAEHLERGNVSALRRYYYDTDEKLPFPEVQTYYLRDLTVTVKDGRRIVDFTSSAYYVPLEPVPELELATNGTSAGL